MASEAAGIAAKAGSGFLRGLGAGLSERAKLKLEQDKLKAEAEEKKSDLLFRLSREDRAKRADARAEASERRAQIEEDRRASEEAFREQERQVKLIELENKRKELLSQRQELDYMSTLSFTQRNKYVAEKKAAEEAAIVRARNEQNMASDLARIASGLKSPSSGASGGSYESYPDLTPLQVRNVGKDIKGEKVREMADLVFGALMEKPEITGDEDALDRLKIAQGADFSAPSVYNLAGPATLPPGWFQGETGDSSKVYGAVLDALNNKMVERPDGTSIPAFDSLKILQSLSPESIGEQYRTEINAGGSTLFRQLLDSLGDPSAVRKELRNRGVKGATR